MARDVPSPCCGSYEVTVKESLTTAVVNDSGIATTKDYIEYSCHCGKCGLQYGDSAESRSEALYNYDQRCFELWRKNPNGLQGWMLTKPTGEEDVKRRQMISKQIRKNFSSIFG